MFRAVPIRCTDPVQKATENGENRDRTTDGDGGYYQTGEQANRDKNRTGEQADKIGDVFGGLLTVNIW